MVMHEYKSCTMKKQETKRKGMLSKSGEGGNYENYADAVQCNAMRYDTIRHDTIRYDTIRYDTIRYDTIRYDTIQYNTSSFISNIEHNNITTTISINKIT